MNELCKTTKDIHKTVCIDCDKPLIEPFYIRRYIGTDVAEVICVECGRR